MAILTASSKFSGVPGGRVMAAGGRSAAWASPHQPNTPPAITSMAISRQAQVAGIQGAQPHEAGRRPRAMPGGSTIAFLEQRSRLVTVVRGTVVFWVIRLIVHKGRHLVSS